MKKYIKPSFRTVKVNTNHILSLSDPKNELGNKNQLTKENKSMWEYME